MRLKQPVRMDNEILGALVNHFAYRMSMVRSYGELTPAEKEIISPEVFDLLLEPTPVNDDRYKPKNLER